MDILTYVFVFLVIPVLFIVTLTITIIVNGIKEYKRIKKLKKAMGIL